MCRDGSTYVSHGIVQRIPNTNLTRRMGEQSNMMIRRWSYYSVPNIGYRWGTKERPDQDRTRFHIGEIRLDTGAERFVFPQRLFADSLALEVVPDEFIRIEVGRVAW